jgi:hypothetical protein
MLEVFLYILIGAAAGVLSFMSCVAIWDIEFKKSTGRSTDTPEYTKEQKTELPVTDSSLHVPPESAVRSTLPLHQQEIALTDEKYMISGSFIDVERKIDGVKTAQRVFLN